MSLYSSGYRPRGLSRSAEATGIMVAGEGQAAEVLRRKGVPESYGDPFDAVAFWHDDGHLLALVGDYANGRRATFRQLARSAYLDIVRVPASTATLNSRTGDE